MKNAIFYHKGNGQPVQIIARAQTKPTFQEVICYQELTHPYEYYVMEKRSFFAEYVSHFEDLALAGRKQIEKRQDLPDKQPLISAGETADISVEEQDEIPEETSGEKQDVKIQRMMAFFDASDYSEKLKLFDKMADDLEEHMLNNIAASLDIPPKDGVDVKERIRAELNIRSRYEGKRGDRL